MHPNTRLNVLFRRSSALALLAIALASTNQAQSLASTAPTPLGADIESRKLELQAHGADATFLRLDEFAAAEVRIDVFLGGHVPASMYGLHEFLEQFTFNEGGAQPTEPLNDDRDPADWRTVFIPGAIAQAGTADATYFDPQRNLLLEFRRQHQSIACSAAWTINFNGTGNSGANYYWYFSGDVVWGVTGSRRDRNSNPDLYMYIWNGSAYAYQGGSASGNMLDQYMVYSSSCSSMSAALRVHMSNGGDYCVRAGRVTAN